MSGENGRAVWKMSFEWVDVWHNLKKNVGEITCWMIKQAYVSNISMLEHSLNFWSLYQITGFTAVWLTDVWSVFL